MMSWFPSPPNSWDWLDIALHGVVGFLIVATTGGWGVLWNSIFWPFREWEQHRDKPVAEWSLQIWFEAIVPVLSGVLAWWLIYGS